MRVQTLTTIGAVAMTAALVGCSGSDSVDPPLPPIQVAVEHCGVRGVDGFLIGDRGESVWIDGPAPDAPDDPLLGAAKSRDVACVLRELNTPDGLVQKMEQTTINDGDIYETVGDLVYGWTNSPGDGLDIIIDDSTLVEPGPWVTEE